MSITDIGKEAAEATSPDNDGGSSGGSSSESEYERIDVSGMGYAKVHPGPTAVAGTVVGLRYFPPAPDDQGEYDDEGRGYAGLILEDAYIPDDENMENVALYESTKAKGDDYKIVNTDDESVDTYEVGVSVGQMFEADEVDEFSHDNVIVKLDTSAGRSIARTLDVAGRFNADLIRTDSGAPKIHDHGYPEFNDGLIEKCPDNGDDHYEPPQYIRDTQVRPDLEGQEVVILTQHLADVLDDYDGNSHWATVLANIDDDRQEELAQGYVESEYFEGDEVEDFISEVNGTDMLELAPTDEFEPDADLVDETHFTEWRFLEDDELETLRDEQGVDV